MNEEEIIRRAKERFRQDQKMMAEGYFTRTIAWLSFLGLLRHTTIQPKREAVHLTEALQAGELEPRVYELLPAILLLLPEAFIFGTHDIPNDLRAVLTDLRKRNAHRNFRQVTVHEYLQWVTSPMMDIARRKINYRHVPRRRLNKTHTLGEIIRENRMKLALTQSQLAEKYHLSLRVIRDLEQGKMDASIKNVNEILKVFGKSLTA